MTHYRDLTTTTLAKLVDKFTEAYKTYPEDQETSAFFQEVSRRLLAQKQENNAIHKVIADYKRMLRSGIYAGVIPNPVTLSVDSVSDGDSEDL